MNAETVDQWLIDESSNDVFVAADFEGSLMSNEETLVQVQPLSIDLSAMIEVQGDVFGFSKANEAGNGLSELGEFLVPLPISGTLPTEMADIPLNADDEEILKYLESGAQEPTAVADKMGVAKNKMAAKPQQPQKKIPVKCFNCGLLFTLKAHKEHICDYDENHKLIMSSHSSAFDRSSSQGISPKVAVAQDFEHPCIRLLDENQKRIRRFLKEELKYDLPRKVATPVNAGKRDASGKETNTKYSNICNMCDRSFVHPSGLLRHMEKHALDTVPAAKSAWPFGTTLNVAPGTLRVMIGCPLCGRIFFEPRSAHQHYCQQHYGEDSRAHHETEGIENGEMPSDTFVNESVGMMCKEFDINSEDIEGGHSHPLPPQMKIIVMNCVLQCEFCEFIFSDASFLFMHSTSHLAPGRFECVSCGIHVKTNKEISTHWQTECVAMRENFKLHNANVLRYFVCNVCEDKFPSLDELHEHRYLKYHLFPRLNKSMSALQLPCEYCDTVSPTAQECFTHFKEKHFKHKTVKVWTPVANTLKNRQYLCDICGKSYTQSSHLWQHMRFHQGVKPFACKEPGCDRKFTIRPDLNDHIRKCHTGERPYHCLVCGKRFLTGSVFYQHRLIHRGERRYECDQCHKRFYRADALRNHQRIHTGEKPFGCLYCTKHFRQRGDRDKHLRARHSNLDENTRLMMQMHKLKLEIEAAGRGTGVDGGAGGGHGGSGGPGGVDSGRPREGVSVKGVADRQNSEIFEEITLNAILAESD